MPAFVQRNADRDWWQRISCITSEVVKLKDNSIPNEKSMTDRRHRVASSEKIFMLLMSARMRGWRLITCSALQVHYLVRADDKT